MKSCEVLINKALTGIPSCSGYFATEQKNETYEIEKILSLNVANDLKSWISGV